MFNLNEEILKMENYLYENGEKLNKNNSNFNKIRVILNSIGFDRLKDFYIKILNENYSKNLEAIIEIYKFNEKISCSLIKQLWKIENFLTTRLLPYWENGNLWDKQFGKKIEIFQNLDEDKKISIVNNINKKCSVENYNKGLIYTILLRNRISHINWNFFIPIKINEKYSKIIGNEFYLKDVITILDEISGEEKYIGNIFSTFENIKKYLCYN
ncbi:MAG: hypothetical protein ACRCRZ_01180 [Metamycoplasmataceae bacterium]